MQLYPKFLGQNIFGAYHSAVIPLKVLFQLTEKLWYNVSQKVADCVVSVIAAITYNSWPSQSLNSLAVSISVDWSKFWESETQHTESMASESAQLIQTLRDYDIFLGIIVTIKNMVSPLIPTHCCTWWSRITIGSSYSGRLGNLSWISLSRQN